MQSEDVDLWGPVTTKSSDSAAEPLAFEDSFSPVHNNQHSADSDYVPLEDSSQYLAGLEQKLARLQGRTASSRNTESRRLIDALASSRSTHTSQLMRDDGISTNEAITPGSDPDAAHTSAPIDPQGALGALLRRVAPDKIALAPEELCHLLEADLLSKVHEALEDERPHPPGGLSHNGVTEPSRQDATTRNIVADSTAEINGGVESCSEESKYSSDRKDPSSDEGEK